MKVLTILMSLSLILGGTALAQEDSSVGINLGISSWINNCDVPAAGQDSGLQPAFGPNFSISIGKFRVGGTFYLGNFDIHPEDGLVFGSALDPVVGGQVSADTVLYSDEEARARGFTSTGTTKRIDFTLNAGYAFSRYAVLSLSLVINRHEVDLNTFWPPTNDANGVITNLPSDRPAPMEYTDTQFWFGQQISGSIPVETVSTRFSVFYGAGLLVILGESGDGSVGNTEIGPRTSYTDEDGQLAFPPRPLGTRSLGENIGITFNAGVGFQLFTKLGLYGGYNFKFFAEDETDVIDHSRFHGPFFGLTYTVM
ncbi:MAG: hypothetical protein ACE5G1_13670 [bacterium]